jgi:hypothetical protein
MMTAWSIGRIIVGPHVFGPELGSRKVVQQIEYDRVGVLLGLAIKFKIEEVINELTTGTWFVNMHENMLTFDGEERQFCFELREEVVPFLTSEQLDVLSLGLGSIASKIGFKTQVDLFQTTLKATF